MVKFQLEVADGGYDARRVLIVFAVKVGNDIVTAFGCSTAVEVAAEGHSFDDNAVLRDIPEGVALAGTNGLPIVHRVGLQLVAEVGEGCVDATFRLSLLLFDFLAEVRLARAGRSGGDFLLGSVMMSSAAAAVLSSSRRVSSFRNCITCSTAYLGTVS